jgi:predicted branched-subunit amino acid permease
MHQATESPAPYWSFGGLAVGARMVLALMPGVIAFGVAVGSAAAAKGFTLVESLLLNALVYAVLSQMVELEVWPQQMTFGALAGLALLAATVNARMLLLGAGLRPWFGALPAWQTYPLLHFLTEPGWIVAMRYRSEGGADMSIFLGGALVILAFWMGASTAGYLLGALVPNAQAIGLDLVMPVFFVAMLVTLWRGATGAIPWIVAGVVALVVDYLVGGWWYVVAGGLAGSLAGGFVDDRG